MVRRVRNPWWLLVFVIGVGAVLGSVIAESLQGYPGLSFLSRDLHVGLDPPLVVDARVLTLTFGTTLRLNLAIVLGIILAIWIFRMLQ